MHFTLQYWWEILPCFDLYVVTRSYSTHPFLCAKSDTADFMQQLQFITEECKERFFKMEQQVNKLKWKLKEKDEELIAAQHQ